MAEEPPEKAWARALASALACCRRRPVYQCLTFSMVYIFNANKLDL